MKHGDFEVKIIGADAAEVSETAGGYVGLAHDEPYAIKLTKGLS